jgi:hypothetical protein
MKEDLAARFDALRPAIKARWATMLGTGPAAAPAATGFVTPDMLVFMLDDTLARLTDRLRKSAVPDGLRRDLGPFEAVGAGCQCGLHLLLTYYKTGGRALDEGLPAKFGPGRVEILHSFNELAHDEMAALCGICRHRGGTECSLQPGHDFTGRPG